MRHGLSTGHLHLHSPADVIFGVPICEQHDMHRFLLQHKDGQRYADLWKSHGTSRQNNASILTAAFRCLASLGDVSRLWYAASGFFCSRFPRSFMKAVQDCKYHERHEIHFQIVCSYNEADIGNGNGKGTQTAQLKTMQVCECS